MSLWNFNLCLFNQKVGKVGVIMSLELETKAKRRFMKIAQSELETKVHQKVCNHGEGLLLKCLLVL